MLNQTPFYGESGGQVGDQGVIKGAKGALFRVTDTQKKLGDVIVHIGRVEKGTFKPGDAVELVVDHARRTATRANHSATHLLHEALRQVLGTHVAQKGSLVAPERLRFDFSHTKPMTPEEIAAVEAMANAFVLQNSAGRDAPDGARGRHGDRRHGAVRREVRRRGARRLDGRVGTPAGDTKQGQQGLVGRAVRRHARGAHRRHRPRPHRGRERQRGGRAPHRGADGRRRARLSGRSRMPACASWPARCAPSPTTWSIASRPCSRSASSSSASSPMPSASSRSAAAAAANGKGVDGAGAAIRTVGDIKLLARTVQGLNPKDLRGLIDDGKKQVGSGVVAIVGVTEDGKAGLAVGVTDDLTKRISAVDLVKAGAEALGGKGGGGRPDMAQAGGPDGSKAEAALEAIEARLAG